MKRFEIKIEWEIRDTRDVTGSYRTGTSSLVVEASKKEKVINSAINFARSIPSWEFERNGIDLEQYREGKICTYYYMTMLSKVLSIKQER